MFAGLASFTTAFAAELWKNDITGTNPNLGNPYTTGQVTDANVTATGIGRGAGVTGVNGNDRYIANSWNTASLDTTAFFTFTLAPTAGYELDLSNFIYTGQASGTGPTSFQFSSSLDSFATAIGTPAATGATIDLSGAAYQNLTSSVTFRLYGWGASAGTGTFSVNSFVFNGDAVLTGGGGGGGGSNFLFDTNGATAGAGTLGGIYNWTDASWSSATAGNTATGAFTDGQTPTFSAGTDGTGTYSVTVDTAVSAAGLTVEEGNVTLAAGSGTLTLASAAVSVASGSSLTVTEPLLGTAGLSKTGSGVLTLAANAGYTGATSAGAGTLRVGNGGTLGTVPGDLAITGGAVVFNRSNDLAYSGTITGSGALAKEGAGTLTLSGTSSAYTGAITVSAGTLALATATAAGTGSLNVGNGGTLAISGVGLASPNNPGLTLSNGSTLRGTGASSSYSKSNFPSVAAGASVVIDVPNAGEVFTIGSAIRDGNAAAQITVTGAGTLALTSGSAGGTAYAGSWILNGPTLRLSDTNNAALGNPGGAAPRPLTIQAGQVEIRNNAVAGYNNPVTVAANTAFTPNNAGAGTTHNFGTLSIGGYTLAISPGPQVTGGNATVTFGATTLTGNAVFSVGNSGTAGGNLTVASVGEAGGARSLTKAGAGTMTISGGGTFSGDVTVSGGGVLSVASLAGLGTGAGPITVANGSTVEFTSATPGGTARPLSLGAQGGRVNVVSAAATLAFTGGISGTDNTSDFTKAGAGTFNLTAAGTWAGNTFVNGGTLEVSGAGSVNSSGVMTVQGGSRLRVNTSGQVRMPSLDVTGSSSVDLLAGLLRTNSIDIQAGSSFTWTGGTLAVRDTVSDASGNPDLSDAGGAVVAAGRSLAVDGNLSVGGLVDLENLHIAGVVAFNHLDVTGALTFLPGAQLASLGDAYLLRGGGGGPSVESGTLPLVTAASISGFTLSMFAAPTSDAGRPFSPSAFPVTTATRATLLPNTWYLENTGSMLLFHYNVSAAIPEPDSAAMVFLGFSLLRLAGRRRAARAEAEPARSRRRRRF